MKINFRIISMASFAASAYRLPGGSSVRPASYYMTASSINSRVLNARKAYDNAVRKYTAARRAYNNQKKRVSGGVLGYLKRRLPGNMGQKAHNARNSQLNKTNMNNAKRNINAKRQAYRNAGGKAAI